VSDVSTPAVKPVVSAVTAEQEKVNALRAQVAAEKLKQAEIKRKVEGVVTAIYLQVASALVVDAMKKVDGDIKDVLKEAVSASMDAAVEYCRSVLGVQIQRSSPDNPVKIVRDVETAAA
jgi:hypothetical protein